MKKLLALTTLGFACAFGTAWAADAPAPAGTAPAAAKAPTAKDMKGDELKAFMKTCLSNKPEAQATQQSKMKSCNAEAAGKKGAERKTFMSECLKK